jgi:beta-lactamase regulating signal transducer with metallopeptidase domain
MSLPDLVDPLLRSSLLIALAAAAAIGLRAPGASAAMRHLVWLLGLLSILLVPLLAAILPSLPLPLLPEAAAPEFVPFPAAEAAAVVPAAPAASAAPASATIGLGDLFQLLYLAVAAGLLGRLALGQWLLARLWSEARPLSDARSLTLLGALARSHGIARPVTARIAAGPSMPMTWGSLRPRVLLPADAEAWDEERLKVVLLHELAHVARHDSLSRAAAAIVCALYWFNPAVWYAVKQMRREQEHACDDLVLSLGARASVYARNLLDAAHAFQSPRIVGSLSVAMASPSELERRLTAIVSPVSRRRASLRFLAGCGAAALVATSVAASVVPVRAEPDVSTLISHRSIRRAGAPYERPGLVRARQAEAARPTSAERAMTTTSRVPGRAPRRAEPPREVAAAASTAPTAQPNHGDSAAAPAQGAQPAIPAVMPTMPVTPVSPLPTTPRVPPKQGP